MKACKKSSSFAGNLEKSEKLLNRKLKKNEHFIFFKKFSERPARAHGASGLSILPAYPIEKTKEEAQPFIYSCASSFVFHFFSEQGMISSIL
ncbi:MAG TPA: hypothetical protein VFV38_02775, partial [Ktedonobacteraceae bacterium]|nr:hypothetical protein [Ktedonobacteraceae bacterium]